MSAATATRPSRTSTGTANTQKEKGKEEDCKPQPPQARKDEQPVAGIEKKKLFVVVNGKKTGDMHLRAAIKHLREEGHTVEVRVTYEAADSERYVAEAIEDGSYDTIVAAGGDGSINEIGSAMVKLDADESSCLGIVPMGTANDFATGLGISDDPWEALQLAAHSTAHPIDVGTVNGQVFMNVATGGFGTELTVKTDEGMKNQLGGMAYLITGVTSFNAIASKKATFSGPVVSTLKKKDGGYQIDSAALQQGEKEGSVEPVKDGEVVEISGELLILAVGNGQQAGGGVRLCPGAVLDDGYLDVSYVLNVSPQQIPGVLKDLTNMKDAAKLKDTFHSMRVSSLDVECPDGLQINRDGEPMRDTKLQFRILPKRLKVHMPEPSLLKQPSKRGMAAQQAYKQKLASSSSGDGKRPARKEKPPVWQHPIVTAGLKNALVMGLGVVLTVGLQRRQGQDMSQEEHDKKDSRLGKLSRKLQLA
ncbi:hypothetical protein WJX74_002034 [Apatococcus lobatus]|uniref:DAGKc domain-containing protein n=1 Tax=Apatococcus lobatus TaxID=904363 RepID=A0AAW1QLJ2_9CHLO